MIAISVGQGNRNPNAKIVEVDVPTFLAEHPPADEAWWSGHIWDKGYRKAENWIGTTAIVLDVDHHGKATDSNRRHCAPPDERRNKVTDFPCTCWHHTPRGIRVVFELEETCTDADLLARATQGAAMRVEESLSEMGVLARRDKKGKPVDGYAVDVATYDHARLFYTPNAVVDGKARSADVVGFDLFFSVKDLTENVPENASTTSATDTLEDIANILAKLPCEGANDGSNELMKVARKAITLGVNSTTAFIQAAAKWNAQRLKPWSEAALVKRYEDADKRWEDDGLAKVPTGVYRRASLDTILRDDKQYAGKFEWDELDQCIRFEGTPLTDDDVTTVEVDICKRYGFISIPLDAMHRSISSISKKNTRNRVTEYLASIDWDGVDRREAFARAFDVAPDKLELATEYLWRWRLAACARAAWPGCKHDHILVFVGPEAARKSTAFRVLAGDDNFSDTFIDIENKDSFMQIQKAWIIEWSEIETITKRMDVARIKAFLSSCEDTYRAPYARLVATHKRRCAFVASSNSHDIVFDKHANRRFWILESGGRIDLDWIKANRDQLWAEAIYGLGNDERWWLDEKFEAQRTEENATYATDDPVVDRLNEVIGSISNEVSGHELYLKLGVDPIRSTNFLKNVITSEMIRNGFVRKHTKKGTKYVRKHVPENLIVKCSSEPMSPAATFGAASGYDGRKGGHL